MIQKFILSIMCFSIVFSLSAEEIAITSVGYGGGFGMNNSSPYLAEVNAFKELSKVCDSLGGVIKDDYEIVGKIICGEVYSFNGFQSRNCSAKVQGLCVVDQ